MMSMVMANESRFLTMIQMIDKIAMMMATTFF